MRHSASAGVSSAYQRLLDDIAAELAALDAAGLRRQLTPIERVDGADVWIGRRRVANWCSNDYLGLAHHPALVEAAARAARDWGLGARASRLLAGTSVWHQRLEEALAAWFGTEASVVFPSGYQANLGVLGSLLALDDVVLVDRLAHASLVDAARATRATLRVFHHNDVEHLSRLLARAAGARRRVIVTEGLFSMDGDRAPLAALVDAAEAHEALIYLDDAHAAFVEGPRGRGSPEAAGIPLDRFLYMGTLGKALGCQGGFLAGPRALIELVHNRARTFLYTTALAVPVAAAAHAALTLLEAEPQHRQRLLQRAQRLHDGLRAARIASPGVAHIVPVMVGQTAQALALARALMERGIFAPAIRPPTVPKGTSRLRLTLMATHADEDLEQALEVLRRAGRKFGILH